MTDTDDEITLKQAADVLAKRAADPADPAVARPATEAQASLEAMLAAGRAGKKTIR